MRSGPTRGAVLAGDLDEVFGQSVGIVRAQRMVFVHGQVVDVGDSTGAEAIGGDTGSDDHMADARMLRRFQYVPVAGDVGGDVLLFAIGLAVVEASEMNDRVVTRHCRGDRPGVEDVDLVVGDVLPGRRDVEHRDGASREESVDNEAPEATASPGDENLVEAHAFHHRCPDRASASMILHELGEFRAPPPVIPEVQFDEGPTRIPRFSFTEHVRFQSRHTQRSRGAGQPTPRHSNGRRL